MRLTLFFLILLIHPFSNPSLIGKEMHRLDEEKIKQESEKITELSSEYAKFYELPSDVELKDITDDLLNHLCVKDAQKQSIRKFNRRVFVFTYPSDGLKIKGLISFVPDPQNHPLLVYLRGGNRTFSIVNPGCELICFEQYTVISTMYRGGVSEGADEFGGDDVNDVKNLIDFIPELEKKLDINFQNEKAYLLGASRGSMQMFLALSRFPELQTLFSKVVSLTGISDMRQCIASRSDMEEMFVEDFGLEKGVNEEEWINKRDPLLTVNQIMPQLPILIIQGTDDDRVSLEEGYNMVSKLQMAGNTVTYWEIEGAKHCLNNIEDKVELILRWLEE
jgi:dipeptidyl aminopeptidase/acylaminoacyl peptidase